MYQGVLDVVLHWVWNMIDNVYTEQITTHICTVTMTSLFVYLSA